jgi:hypothetical protein
MFKFHLDSDDTFLILTPRWSDLDQAWQVGLLALTLLVPLGLIGWLYRHELRLISRLAAWGLLMLRLLILLVIWLAIGLQPHLADIHVKQAPRRIRIAIDLSASMDVVDRQRTAEEKSALARALRFVEADALTRKQIVARILSSEGLNLLERLADRHQVEIVGFHKQAVDLQPAQLLETLKDKRIKPDILATDLHQALSCTQPLVGVLLFSDGQHNVGAPPYDRADQLGKQHVPIFPVVIGSREPPSDLMLLGVQVPTKVVKDATVPVEMRCKVTNMPAQEISVEMQIDGKPVRAEHRQMIQHDGKDDVYTVRFQAKMDEAGTHTLSIKAASKEQKEITLANNVAERFIRVVDEKAKVLLIDGEARWEYHYLANALLRDPGIALERVVFSQPRIGMIKDDELDQAGLPKTKLPEPKVDRKDDDPLSDFDCILLGDVAPEQLPLADRRRLEKFVAERGGTLILLAGKRYLPLAYTKAADAGDDPLVKMLPVTRPRELTTQTGFTLRVTNEGKLRPFMQLQPGRPAEAWPELPKHYWGVVGKRKPAASVLLAPMFGAAAAQSGDEAETGIMLQQIYGTGRVLFVGLDSTWRWRFRVGDVYHHRFWGQLARWSAAEKLLPAGNRWIRFGPREPVYAEGQEVELAVRLNESLPPLKDALQARAKLYRKYADGTEQLSATVSLAKHPRQTNLLVASVRELLQGTYRMELDIPPYREQLAQQSEEKDAPAKGRDLVRILPRERPELLDLATNWTVMHSLAERSGGKLYTPENVEEIVDRLAQRIERAEHRDERRERRPWQDVPMVWWVLGLLLGLLTLEWGWRKWLDLP